MLVRYACFVLVEAIIIGCCVGVVWIANVTNPIYATILSTIVYGLIVRWLIRGSGLIKAR